MTENEPIKDYAADAAADAPVEPVAPAQPEVTSAGKRRTKAKAGTAAAETFTAPTPQEEVYIDERTRLEMQAGAAMLRENQERLKQAE